MGRERLRHQTETRSVRCLFLVPFQSSDPNVPSVSASNERRNHLNEYEGHVPGNLIASGSYGQGRAQSDSKVTGRQDDHVYQLIDNGDPHIYEFVSADKLKHTPAFREANDETRVFDLADKSRRIKSLSLSYIRAPGDWRPTDDFHQVNDGATQGESSF
jgi:hypothetical protein